MRQIFVKLAIMQFMADRGVFHASEWLAVPPLLLLVSNGSVRRVLSRLQQNGGRSVSR